MRKTSANYVPLSPMSFLNRAARVHPERPAVVYGDLRRTWAETADRCARLASALAGLGVRRGEVVAVLAPNIPALFEAHFGVPLMGGVLNAINTRLDAGAIAFILRHSEARVLIADTEYSDVVERALATFEPHERPTLIDIVDAPERGRRFGACDYETFLARADPSYVPPPLDDEWNTISLNYTSGTTGDPKGVLYHHRGAYLNALGNILAWRMPQYPVYLWTLPMFHCNGWCFPWSIAAQAGVNVCLRRPEVGAMLDAMDRHGVTHMCGAPIIMGMLINAPEAKPRRAVVQMMTAGAAPPAAVLEGMARLGFEVTHTYGLTEVYGPVTVCEWKPEWCDLPMEEQAKIKARQGVPYVVEDGMMVAGADGAPTPQDGVTIGEVLLRGNVVMKGYLKNQAATDAAFAGGWFHTGDLAVWHPDGYAEIKDRAKDIVISGGENISTIEVESVLYRHPAVLEAAVVARPDEKWGETPCAFIALKPGVEATEAEIIAFCREHMARFKAPKTVVFGALPKTSTGKMQKFVLREKAAAL